jgi:hypothetical protein
MKRNDRDKPGSYDPGKTQGQIVEAMAEGLITDAKAGKLARSDTYGMTRMSAKEYTIAGGGPGADVLILFRDGVPVGGYVNYYEGSGVVCEYLDDHAAQLIERGFNGERDDDEDE